MLSNALNLPVGEALAEAILAELNPVNMRETVDRFNKLERYTGSSAGEAAVDYLVQKLVEYGVPTERFTYDALLSLPLTASINVRSPEKNTIKAIADAFSGEAHNLQGTLYYDFMSEKKDLTPCEQDERFSSFRDKIILTRTSSLGDASLSESFVTRAAKAGALGIIRFWPSGEELLHHGSASGVWGTPTPSDYDRLTYLPFVQITKSSGEKLISLLQDGPVIVELNIEMETGVRKSSMPVATIAGASEKYVLISGHYDSWYEGITDNAASDAIMLEFARIFMRHQRELKRSVKIAWWSGHSDGRYAGSTWYCDSHWSDLNKNCVAHINLDLAGCKNAEQIRARTTQMEGKDFMDRLIKEFTGADAKPYIPMVRGADQSFWGVRVPITIMPKYEPLPDKCDFACPSGGAWWHTAADTIDKLDENYMLRDAKLNAKATCLILNARHIPVNIPNFLIETQRFLAEIENNLAKDFDVTSVKRAFSQLEKLVPSFQDAYLASEDSDEILKKVAGELTSVIYTCCDPYHQDPALSSTPLQGLAKACGITRENTSAEKFLFITTEFYRQRNRLVGEINRITETINNYIRA